MNEQELKLMEFVKGSAESKVELLAILKDEVWGAYEMSKDPDLLSKINEHLQQVYKHMNQMLEAQIEHLELVVKTLQVGKLSQLAEDPDALEEAMKGLDEP